MYAMQNLCITAFPYGEASLIELDFYSRPCDVVKPGHCWVLPGTAQAMFSVTLFKAIHSRS